MEILVVGAGLAGSAVAALLGWADHDVTLVERSAGPPAGGTPVEMHGAALHVLERLGVAGLARAADTGVRRVEFADPTGRVRARARLSRHEGQVEIGRAELNRLLLDQARALVDVVVDDTARTLTDLPDGIEVGFERGRRSRFDLVVGADGQHSRVRSLAFGPELDHLIPLGLAVVTMPVDPGLVARAGTLTVCNAPRRMASVHPGGADPVAALIHPAPPGDVTQDPTRGRSRAERVADLPVHFPDGWWWGGGLLAAARDEPSVYAADIQRVELAGWSTGHVVLLGDAAGGVNVLGDGASMALTGAARLVDALIGMSSRRDLRAALRAYEAAHRPDLEHQQRRLDRAIATLVPSTAGGIRRRDWRVRLRRRF